MLDHPTECLERTWRQPHLGFSEVHNGACSMRCKHTSLATRIGSYSEPDAAQRVLFLKMFLLSTAASDVHLEVETDLSVSLNMSVCSLCHCWNSYQPHTL